MRFVPRDAYGSGERFSASALTVSEISAKKVNMERRIPQNNSTRTFVGVRPASGVRLAVRTIHTFESTPEAEPTARVIRPVHPVWRAPSEAPRNTSTPVRDSDRQCGETSQPGIPLPGPCAAKDSNTPTGVESGSFRKVTRWTRNSMDTPSLRRSRTTSH